MSKKHNTELETVGEWVEILRYNFAAHCLYASRDTSSEHQCQEVGAQKNQAGERYGQFCLTRSGLT